MVLHGHTATTTETFRNCIVGIKECAFERSEYPLCITLEDHLNLENQAIVAGILREVLGDLLFVPGADGRAFGQGIAFQSPEELKGKIIIRHKKGKVMSPAEAAKQHSAMLDPANTPTLDHEAIIEHYQEDAELDHEHGKKDEKPPKMAPELVALTYVQKMHVDWENLPTGTSCSFGEPKIIKFSRHTNKAQDMISYTASNLARSYPGGTRVMSSNYCPQMAWDMGVQIAALNFQTNTKPMWLNLGKFRENGCSGFVLKVSLSTFFLPSPIERLADHFG